MKPTIGLIGLLFAFCMSYSGYATSQEVETGIQLLTQNGISYVSGGTGEDQQQAMANLRKEYDLRATFAMKKTGEFLADIKVTIQNPSDEKVFEGASLGPLFFAKLAPGKYKVTADFGGKSQVQSILLKKGGVKDLYFYWERE